MAKALSVSSSDSGILVDLCTAESIDPDQQQEHEDGINGRPVETLLQNPRDQLLEASAKTAAAQDCPSNQASALAPARTLRFQSDPASLCTHLEESVASDNGEYAVHYHIQDTPGFGSVDNLEHIQCLVKHIQAEKKEHLRRQQMQIQGVLPAGNPLQEARDDLLIDLCLYFIAPHRFTPMDRSFIKELSQEDIQADGWISIMNAQSRHALPDGISKKRGHKGPPEHAIPVPPQHVEAHIPKNRDLAWQNAAKGALDQLRALVPTTFGDDANHMNAQDWLKKESSKISILQKQLVSEQRQNKFLQSKLQLANEAKSWIPPAPVFQFPKYSSRPGSRRA
ncbi:hypothetical protein WJX84_004084 [Apatococcus fuscideae]|uniref:Uncharacterized protein n=1 Tax=Apatococcus fuscideae TaxID=2026836 RepID=A0AAW1S602_9CHLO